MYMLASGSVIVHGNYIIIAEVFIPRHTWV